MTLELRLSSTIREYQVDRGVTSVQGRIILKSNKIELYMCTDN